MKTQRGYRVLPKAPVRLSLKNLALFPSLRTGWTEELQRSLLGRSGPQGGTAGGGCDAYSETGLGGEGTGKKGINPIDPNLEALPASLKYRELGRV